MNKTVGVQMKNIYGLLLVVFYISTAHAQGNALAFDGSNDFVELSSSINLVNSSYTLECWFKVSVQSGHFIVVGSSTGNTRLATGISLNPGDPGFPPFFPATPANIQFWMYGDDHYYDWTNDGNWHHVAFTYNSSNQLGTLYLDGTSVASATFGGNMTGSGKARLCASTWATDGPFTGQLDEVRIWNTVRTASEISNNKNNSSLSPSTAGLVAYYHFDQGTSGGDNTGVTTLTDATPNSYNGTLNNFALTGTSSNWVGENNASLPVELVSFNAINLENKIALRWQTATEVNNYGFEVEKLKVKNQKSYSDIKWENIGFVKGNGNSNSAKEYSFIDDQISAGKYLYRLKQIDNDGKYEYSEEVEVDFGILKEFSLNQNYPNPFNPETKISYHLPTEGRVSLKIFDVLGKEVADLVNEEKSSGAYKVNFDGSKFASGIYYYQLKTGNFIDTKKMILMK